MITRTDAQNALKTTLPAELARKGMSQSDLARALFGDEIGPSERMKVSRWCNGTAFPDLVDMANIAEIFGCSVDHLLSLNKRKKVS